MTTQRLRGIYNAGYTISAAYSLLKIDDTAVIKGVGLIGGAPVKIENKGKILAGKGVDGSAGHAQGRDGNTGINLAGGDRVVNFGSVSGGQGGAGYGFRTGGYAGVGGAGGAAVVFGATGSVTNRNLIIGGDGGAGGARLTGGGLAGEGGDGGAGILLIAGGDVIDSASITGGSGGVGGYGLQGRAAGGVGGSAIELRGASTVSIYNGTVTGGQGGAGGGGAGAVGGDGGAGGSAIAASAYDSLKNNGVIEGGQGGLGRIGRSDGGAGGAGGAGVLLGGGGYILNSASIVGGNSIMIAGGDGGAGGQGGADSSGLYPVDGGAGGDGGAAIVLSSGGAVTNRSTAQGGAGGSGGGAPFGTAGVGGAGAMGIDVTGGAAILSNTGLIQGGQGGAGGVASGGAFLGGGGPDLTAGDGGTGGAGVYLSVGGSLVNSGDILGGAGGAGGAGPGSAAGGDGGDGVDMRTGVSVINHGLIMGGVGGFDGATAVYDPGGLGNHAPSGGQGTRGAGVVLVAGCYLLNDADGVIGGRTGVVASGPDATVVNSGTISGDLNSVRLTSARDVLIAESGARFLGAVAGGGGTFSFAGGMGTISGLGGNGVVSGTTSAAFSGFGSYAISGTGFTLAGVNTLSGGDSLTDNGVVTVTGSLSEGAGSTITVGLGDSLTFRGGGDSLSGTIAGTGTVSFTSVSDTFDGVRLTAANVAVKTSTITLRGVITEIGVLTVVTSTLLVGAGGATLSGGGTVALSDNGANRITGISPGNTLTNVDMTISGAGMLGAGQMPLVNKAGGTINGNGTRVFTLDTGVAQIANDGLIEATGAGGVAIQSAIANTGVLEANGGVVTVNGAVTGGGAAVIASGALNFTSSFSQNVTFTGTAGMLELAQSQAYKAAISGFSHSGGTSLDLVDIAFAGANEATYLDNGSKTGGVLTVTDGVHTAKITLVGDYSKAVFTASGDGHGGVAVVDRTPPGAPDPRLVEAMAGFGARDGGAVQLSADAWRPPPHHLAGPRAQVA